MIKCRTASTESYSIYVSEQSSPKYDQFSVYNVQLYFVTIHFLFCSKSVLHPIGIWHWSNARDFFHLIFAHRASRLLDELCNDVSNWIHTVVIIQKERDSPGLNIKNFSNESDPSYINSQNLPVHQNWGEKLKIGYLSRSILIDSIISKFSVQMFRR